MVELKSISKVYDGRTVVDSLSLSIPKGVCYGLLGPNGAGKSTTISILTGIVRPDGGEVWIDGRPENFQKGEYRRIFGYAPQDLALYEELSALANLQLFGALYGLEGALLKNRLDEVVEIAQLEDRLKDPVRLFSGGMKRRLNIAVSLLHDPELLILDEPTVGVDPQSRNLIFEALEELIRRGKTILYTTHYMEEIERLCSRVAIMDHGRIIADDTLDAVLRLLPFSGSVFVELSRSPSKEQIAQAPVPVEWTPDSPVVKIEAHENGLGLVALLEQIQNSLGPITAVNTEKVSLEQLFLHLTGRNLRD